MQQGNASILWDVSRKVTLRLFGFENLNVLNISVFNTEQAFRLSLYW